MWALIGSVKNVPVIKGKMQQSLSKGVGQTDLERKYSG